ncbi:MAG: zinc-binding dehydrogenase [Actinobacteria bacterium]|nr:zinc-binding dehydrogenase [Actinomycetota bacterium]
MFAVYADSFSPTDPLSGLVVGELPEPQAGEGWTTIEVRAASLNHHDLWTLRGVGITENRLPMTLGCDAAGIDEHGNEVVLHSVIAPSGVDSEIEDPHRSLLSEVYQGTFADRVIVPRRNVLSKPAALTFSEAACLPTAWLTAYRMLVAKSGTQPGDTVLIQGAGGGVTTAAIVLARTMGLRVWVTSRSADKRDAALTLGAHEAFESGARLPHRVDAVLETVGAATWEHSVKSLRPGGRIVISGATSGPNPPAELARIFFKELAVLGSTMGTKQELQRLLSLCEVTGIRPLIDRELPMSQAREGLAAMAEGNIFGKIVLTR